MKIYLAGNAPWQQEGIYNEVVKQYQPFVLESFYYIKDTDDQFLKLRPYFKDFLLDSGAFTYMEGNGNKVDFNEYAEEYAEFIKQHGINKFFELDIDAVIGHKKVKQLRAKIEQITGKSSIPVWHKSRGIDEWHKLVKDYDYVAIGGIVSGEIKRKEFPAFKKLIKIARQNRAKVHGLGFTNVEGMKIYPFYSVDSTAWIYGNRGGYIYRFNGGDLQKIKPENKKLKGKEAAKHNFKEWCKFANYANDKRL